MGLRAEAPMFSFNCCSLGRDDKVCWGSVGFYSTFRSMTKEAVCLVPWTQRSPELLRTLRSHRFHAWLWGTSGLFPGRWDMKRVPQPPAGLGQGLRAMGIVALRIANTSLHSILPWSINTSKMENKTHQLLRFTIILVTHQESSSNIGCKSFCT